ncbi:hypothetical protein QR680_008937 [Steinernema hermaphroditum]|uniref:BTB domain-containing protein n=1 Tax=Steinernema hermaphroditum TaxID=289476 RepID=A0AA39IKU8_9BILA|nr:hypothetical protein QR680_008937 [Steinernema hermaphroditum]
MLCKEPLRFTINTSTPSSEANPLYSVSETIDGLKWKIEVYRDALDGFYVFRLECRGPTPISGNWLWSCNALCRFDIISDNINIYNYSTSISGTLNSCNHHSHHKMVTLDHSFLAKESFDVEIRLYTFRLWKLNMQQKNHSSDIEVIVENRRYFVSKPLLQIQSDYLKQITSTGENPLTLPNILRSTFLPFLLFAYPADVRINAANVRDYLQIASSFQSHAMFVACGEFLSSYELMSTVERLRLAHGYNMPAVVQKIVNDQSETDLKALSSTDLPREVKRMLRYRNLELGYGDCQLDPSAIIEID